MFQKLLLIIFSALSVFLFYFSDQVTLYKRGIGIQSPNSFINDAADGDSVFLQGKIMFANYLSMDGKPCSAFMESPEGKVICVLDNDNAAELAEKLDYKSGRVTVSGTIIKKSFFKGPYIKLSEYAVVEKYKK